jgi:hypothetical protein
VAEEQDTDPELLREAMKKVAVVLKQAGVPFALAGGYAAYARGGPESDHDVDFYLRPDDVEAAEEAVQAAGLRVEHPPEDWLVKVFDDNDAMVDLIFAPTGFDVTGEVLGRSDEVEVDSVAMPVLPATDVLASMLLAMKESYCDFEGLFPIARALREQVDWARLDADTAHNPFAQAFLWICAELDLRPRRSL